MSIGAQRQRRGNTLATGHRIALVRWIIQIVGIAETISLKRKTLSCVLWERMEMRKTTKALRCGYAAEGFCSCAPGMGNNSVVKVHHALGSRKR